MERPNLVAIFCCGIFVSGGITNAVQVLPSCDDGGYLLFQDEEACFKSEIQKEQKTSKENRLPVDEFSKEAPKAENLSTKGIKQDKTVVKRTETTYTDWGPYKEKSPQELLQIIKSLIKEKSPIVSYPQNAPVGCCYGKLVKPPTYKKITVKYIKEDGGLKVKIKEAQFKEIEKKILVRPPYHKIEVIPPKYEVKTEKILLAPSRPIWTYENGVYCKVEVPAEYITVTRKVLVEPPKCKKILVPAEYKIIKIKELVRDATCTKEPMPPKYDVKSKTFMVKGPEVIWDAILCDVNLKPEEIKIIQRKLKELGYYKGTINGKLDEDTMAAVVKFQVDHNLPAGNISIETLQAMGLNNLAKNYEICEVKNLK